MNDVLKDLSIFYERHCDTLPAYGYTTEPVASAIVIDMDGNIKSIRDYNDKVKGEDGKIHGIPLVVPEHQSRSSEIRPYFLCDKLSYLLYKNGSNKFSKSEELHEKILSKVSGNDVQYANAILSFFARMRQEGYPHERFCISDAQDNNAVILILDDSKYIETWCLPSFKIAWEQYWLDGKQWMRGRTEIVRYDPIEEQDCILAPTFQTLSSIQDAGINAKLVSYNQDAFAHYGNVDKQKYISSPFGYKSAFRINTAINYLLASEEHHTNMCGTTIIYWSDETSSPQELDTNDIIDMILNNDSPKMTDADVSRQVNKLRQGRIDNKTNKTLARLHVIGLIPNNNRIAIAFYESSGILDVISSVSLFIEQSSIATTSQPLYATAKSIFNNTIQDGKKSIDPSSGTLLPQFIRCLLYPETTIPSALYAIAIRHCVSTIGSGRLASRQYIACLRTIKMTLIRNYNMEVNMSLDESNVRTPYLLGRAFSIMNNCSRIAMNSKEGVITPQYIRSVTTSPSSIFPTLIQKFTTYCERIQPRTAHTINAELTHILGTLPSSEFPSSFDAKEQGEFLLGYYQQTEHDIQEARRHKAEQEHNDIITSKVTEE